jgi:hypothetical protein
MRYINTGKSSQIAQTAILLRSAGGQLAVSSAANKRRAHATRSSASSFFATLYNMKIKRRLTSSEENRISSLSTHSISGLEHFQLHTEPSTSSEAISVPWDLNFIPTFPTSLH